MVIPVFNPPINNLERSYFSKGTSTGVTALTVDNNNNFAQNDRIMLGELGREKTEIVTVTGAVSAGTDLTISPAVFPHEAGEPVTRLRFDQAKYYRSTTGKDGTYALLAGTPVTLDVDNADLLTNFDDTSGIATYYYKVSFYHSISTLESSLSDPIAGSGYSRNSVGFMIDEILREVADENEQFVTRTEVLGWFNEVNDDLLARVKRPYAFLKTRAAYSRTAADSSGNGTTLPFPDDMWKFDRMDYNYVDNTVTPTSNTTYTVRVLIPEEFRSRFDNTNFSDTTLPDDKIQFISLDSALGRFRLYPHSKTASSNVFYIYYWKTFDQLDSEADVFETPTPRIYKLYSLYKFNMKKVTDDSSRLPIADRYLVNYNAEVNNMRRGDNKDAGSPKGFRYLPQDSKGNRKY